MTISDNSTIVASRDLLCCDLADGAVILDLKSGVYYGLDAVGTYVWALIQKPKELSDIVARVLGEYAVERERCVNDLQRLFGDMARLNLIEVRDATIK